LREPRSRSGNQQAASRRGQISGWKARSTFICGHSYPFVVQNYPCVSLRVFASSREAHVAQTPFPQRQSAVSQSQRADLGLESPIYIHLWPFVSIRGSKSPLRFPWRLRVFARGPRCTNPVPAAAICSQPVAEGRSRAGKPDLHSFVAIRVHSCPFVVQRYPCVSGLSRLLSSCEAAEGNLECGDWERIEDFVSHRCCGLRRYGAGRRCRGTDE
jgi:hypothetical protein